MNRDCPYVGCEHGAVAPADPPYHCIACRRPVKFCTIPDCGSANRPLARFCRACGAELPAARTGGILANLPCEQDAPKLVQVNQRVPHVPIAFADSLWFITVGGELLRLSVREERPQSVKTIGGGNWGARPLLTRNLRREPCPDAIVAHSEFEAHLVELDSGYAERLCRSEDGLSFISDQMVAYTSVAQDADAYYLLGRHAGTAAIVRVGRRDLSGSPHLLPEADVAAGPVGFGSAVLAFGHKYIYWLLDDRIGYQLWPPGFRPCVSMHEAGGLSAHPASGQLPYAVSGRTVYILGTKSGAPAFALVSDFNGSPVVTSFSIDDEPCLIAQCGDGPLLAVRQGEVALYDGSIRRPLHSDDDVTLCSAPFYDGRNVAAHVTPAGAGKQLRVGHDGAVRYFSLADRGDYADGMGFAVCSGRLAHMYSSLNGEKARFLLWCK